ncbi:MAG: FAD-dependent oxidoreductase [Chloroflexota bacterium]|nr:FAD-dependent oxidoreductase [Chloroflexota bacterium]
METVDYTRAVPVVRETDVLVIGGGPAGIGAAIGAAKTGAKTLLVERYGFLGGNATASLVGPFMTSYSADGKTQLIQGVFDELVRRMEAVGGAIHPSKVPAGVAKSAYMKHGHTGVTPFDPEAMKIISAEMCLEYGVALLLHTIFIDPIMDGDTVRGAILHNKSGLQAVRAAVTIDCSADADVAARAGAPFAIGRASDGLTQPMTMFFRVGNVNRADVDAYFAAHPEEIAQRMAFSSCIKAAQANGDYTIPRERLSLYESPQEGVWRVNVSRILGADGTNADDLTRAEITGRRQALEILAFLRKYVPGFGACTLLDTAAQVGVRETRRIVGAYTLTQEDLTTGRDFADTIAYAAYPMDIHSPTDGGGGVSNRGETANAYQIPYRCLVPEKIEQLLVAGRCVSATHEALGAIRVMPPSFAMGEAAGTAAALAVSEHLTPRSVPIAWVQETLVKHGAYLGPRAGRSERGS